jgi:hypothetical protein
MAAEQLADCAAMADDRSAAELEHDEFMRRAKFCIDFAVTLSDPGIKASLLDMAARWRQLAEEAKARERS